MLASGAQPACMENDSSGNGGVQMFTTMSFTWTLSPDGTTAQVSQVANLDETYPQGPDVTCVVTNVQTATKQ
jgi:hypothetical protein